MKKITGVLLMALIIAINFYVFTPALNAQSVEFWIFLFFSLVIISGISGLFELQIGKTHLSLVFATILGFLAIILLLLVLFSASLFNSKTYSSLIKLEEGNFQEDIQEISFTQIPKIDRDTAKRLGDRKMGEMVELVSQFNVADDYTQISVDGKPVRVSPLQYNGFFKWFNNRHDGIPGYVQVDMVDGQAKLIQLEKNIKYSKSDNFSRNIYRHLRFNYLTSVFGDIRFEIDDDGVPYYIAPIKRSNAGLFGAKDVSEVVLVNAITGEHEKYKITDVPQWIDRVYDAETIVNHLDWNGSLHLGFWNSKFAEKGVTYTTEGYNYLAINNDVFLYTGITSAGKDESNIGFVLVNMRTKETKFYKVPSAEEYSAMGTAEGAVQEKEYVSTFPILLNIAGKPTYFVSLKDNAGLTKMYGFIDAENYQKVSVADTVEKALSIHKGIKKENDEIISNKDETPNEDLENLMGTIDDIAEVVINGNTHYYIKVKTSNNEQKVILANISITSELAFLKIGDEIKVEYAEGKDNKVYKLEKLN